MYYLVMKPSIILKKLNGDGLINTQGRGLDLGFGAGNEVLNMAMLGLIVDAVDSNEETIKSLKNSVDNEYESRINLIQEKIENFKIEDDKYDCIIASNSLPFIRSKDLVKDIVSNIVKGLKTGGCFYLTFFGNKDAWSEKENMSFFEYDEIKSYLDSLDIKFYHSTIEEGFGKTMKGDLKYWNIFKFIYIKN